MFLTKGTIIDTFVILFTVTGIKGKLCKFNFVMQSCRYQRSINNIIANRNLEFLNTIIKFSYSNNGKINIIDQDVTIQKAQEITIWKWNKIKFTKNIRQWRNQSHLSQHTITVQLQMIQSKENNWVQGSNYSIAPCIEARCSLTHIATINGITVPSGRFNEVLTPRGAKESVTFGASRGSILESASHHDCEKGRPGPRKRVWGKAMAWL